MPNFDVSDLLISRFKVNIINHVAEGYELGLDLCGFSNKNMEAP